MVSFNKTLIVLLLISVARVSAQGPVVVDGKLPQLPSVLGPLGGLPVECIDGCSASSGVTEPEDNDVAPGQTMGRQINLQYVFDGVKWIRATTSSGGLTDAQIRATPLPVSFTTPISVTQSGTWNIGTVTAVTSITNPVAVTGTFWQTTQPVSFTMPALVAGSAIVGKFGIDQTTDGTTNKVYVGNIPHVIVDTAPTTAVTFTQPISVTQSGTWNIATVTTLTSITNPVAVTQSGTWTVQPGNTANSTPWLVTGTGGTFPICANAKGTSPAACVTALVLDANQNLLEVGSYQLGNWTISGPALTKGTQGATGYSTQDLKDAGRTIVTITAERVVPVLTTDTVVTFTKLVGDTATGSVTTYAVTSGKTLRLQYIHIALTPSSTTLGVIQVRLRTLSSGACIASSTKVMQWELGNPGTATQVANAASVELDALFPDGVEFSGSTRNICISMNALAAAAQVVTISLVGYEY